MDIKIVDEAGKEVEQESTEVGSYEGGVNGGQPDEVIKIAISQVFELDQSELKGAGEKLGTIAEWIKTQGDNLSPIEIKWTLRNLEARLGTPPFGESRLSRISRYAFLDMEGKRIEQEKKTMYGDY